MAKLPWGKDHHRAASDPLMLASVLRASLAAALLTAAGLLSAGAALGAAGHVPVPGASLTQLEAAAPRRTLSLRAAPRHPVIGQTVSLRVSGAPADAQFQWSWTAPADGRSDSGPIPGMTIRLLVPGIQRVTVRVVTGGDTQSVTLNLPVAAAVTRIPPSGRRHDRPHVRAERHRVAQRAGAGEARVAARVEHGSRDPAVAIADFHFTPATITIHVGDTVTWTNQGPSPHTATASDGSFNTGVLQKGQSASHTFTRAGTFAYTCGIHPFMHGTVVVLPAAGTPSSATAPSSTSPAGTTTADSGGHSTAGTPASAAAGSASTPAMSQPTLPVTGANLILVAVAGLLLGAAGMSLRLMLAR